jgi:polyphenol oxidase
VVRAVASTRADGDFHLDRVHPDELERRRRSLVDLPWTMLHEVHGVGLVEVTTPGGGDRSTGDVLVTDRAGAALGVWAGDCAPVVVVGELGRFAVVHAGWRGLAAGVLDVAAAAVASDGGGVTAALLGPSIGPCCYEFGRSDLEAVAAGVGTHPDSITSTTSTGALALDVAAAVTAGLARHGVTVDHVTVDHGGGDHGGDGPRAGCRPVCTGCGGQHSSHRARAELERHVLVAWKDAP